MVSMQTSELLDLLSLFLPENVLRYFDPVDGERSREEIHLVFEEKNDPPLEKRHRGLPVVSKGFQDITVTDFPVRGRKTTMTFRRRRWQAGDELLKRKIELCAPGTQLEKEFGDFLKVLS